MISKLQPPHFRRTLLVLAVLIVLCAAPAAVWVTSSGDDALFGKRSSSSSVALGERGEDEGPRRTRPSIRPEAGRKATHGSHQLRDFYLPPLDFEGTPLLAALEKVRAAYEQACRDSGEQALQVAFKVPPGINPILHVKTRCRTLESTVHLLAGAAKLGVSRHGGEYRFYLPPKGDGRTVSREFDFPLGIGSTDYLAQLGITLDPGTRVTSHPGSVNIESSSPGDLAAIQSLALSASLDPHISQVLKSKIVKLPAGFDWTHGDQRMLSDAEVQSLMRECASRKGVDMLTCPSIMLRPEEDARIEITKELTVKADDPAGGFETHPVGIVVNANLCPLGFGYQTKAHLSITDGEVNPMTGRPVIDQQADLSVENFATDAGTIMKVQTHPDGSRTVLMLSPVLIDATGRPVRTRDEP